MLPTVTPVQAMSAHLAHQSQPEMATLSPAPVEDLVGASAPEPTPSDEPVVEDSSRSGGTTRDHDKALVRTAGNAALVAVGMVISGAFGYVQTLAMTHMVTRSTYGIFVVMFTLATFVGSLTKIGLDGTVLRFLPSYRVRNDSGHAAGLVRIGLLAPLSIALLCAVGLFVGAPVIARLAFHSPAYTTALREGAVLLPLLSIQGMLVNGLLALKAIKWQVLVGKVVEPVVTPAMLVVFYLLGLRLEALIFAYIVSISLSVLLGWILFRRAVRKVIRGATPAYESRVWVRFGAALLFGTMTNSVIQSTDVLGVGAVSTAANVGLYQVSDRVSSLISLPIFALSSIFAPTIAELHTRGDHAQLGKMFAVIARWMFTLGLPIFLCCVIFTTPILAVFGKDYTTGGEALLVLAAGNLVNAGTGPVNNMVAMTSRVRVLWFNTLLRLVVNVSLIVLLVPRWAVLGAAIASSLTVVVSNAVALIEIRTLLKFQPYRWAMLKPIAAGGIATLFGLLLMRVAPTLAHTTAGARAFLNALTLVGIFVFVYALALWRLGLNREDRAVFAAIRSRMSGGRSAAGVPSRSHGGL